MCQKITSITWPPIRQSRTPRPEHSSPKFVVPKKEHGTSLSSVHYANHWVTDIVKKCRLHTNFNA